MSKPVSIYSKKILRKQISVPKIKRRFRYLGQEVLPPPPVPSIQDQWLRSIAENVRNMSSTIILETGLVNRQIAIGTTPIQVVDGRVTRGYIFLNPTPTAGLTSTGTLLASALRAGGASGNTQATAVGVASYRTARLFLDISATGGGVVTVNAQSQDPISLNWATVPSLTDVFGSPSAVGTYYVDLGEIGVDRSFAVSWDVSAAGSSTFSLGYVLKDGLAGGSTGLSNTIYLGPEGVSSISGFPLLEGQSLPFYFRSNVKLYAVSLSSTTLSIFDLQ